MLEREYKCETTQPTSIFPPSCWLWAAFAFPLAGEILQSCFFSFASGFLQLFLHLPGNPCVPWAGQVGGNPRTTCQQNPLQNQKVLADAASFFL